MTELSPATQAVLTAYGTHPLRSGQLNNDLMRALAAGIRAAVEQVSSDPKLLSMNTDACIGMGHAFYSLISIAEEIEATYD